MQILREKLPRVLSQPLCSPKACSHIVFHPSHAEIVTMRRSRGDCEQRAAVQETQHPPLKSRGNAAEAKKRVLISPFSHPPHPVTFPPHLVNTHQRFPVILHALLVCCASLFPLILLTTYTALNKGAAKNVEWMRRRFTSQQVMGGGWVGGVSPHSHPIICS